MAASERLINAPSRVLSIVPIVRRLVGESTLEMLDKASADRKPDATASTRKAETIDALAALEPRPWERPALRPKFAEVELQEHVAAMRAELGLG